MLWLEWGETAFAAARERRVPVLLFIRAAWCRWSREIERKVFLDPGVSRLVAERFVAVRVDKDRRPDIDARYSKGGWPTLAWLDDSGELLGADNYLEPRELALRLELVSETYTKSRDVIRARLARAETPPASRGILSESGARVPTLEPALSLQIVEQVPHTLMETSDPVQGGWGPEQKFPHPEAIDFLLIRWSQTGDATILGLARKTLRKM